MEFDINIRYQEEYLPTKRHRIPRIREVEDTVKIKLREIPREDAPVAMIVSDYKSYIDENGEDDFGIKDTDYLAVDGKLYAEKRDMFGALDKGPYVMDAFIKDASKAGDCRFSWKGKDKKSILRSLKDFASSHVYIDGKIYEQAGEPRYFVTTFGFGNNHGGTALMIHNSYRIDDHSCYFNALQKNDAVAYATDVATYRRDTDSLGTFGERTIRVLMPEMVRCAPNLEHSRDNRKPSLEERIGDATVEATQTNEARGQRAQANKLEL